MDFQAFWQSIPAPLRAFILDRIRGFLKAIGGVLVASGAMTADQVPAFTAIVLGLVTYAAGEIWSWMREKELPRLRQELADLKRSRAAAAPAPIAPVLQAQK